LIKDLKQLYPILSDISIEESNIDINQRSVSTSDYPVMNNCECLSPFSNSPISNNSEELLSGNSNELFNYNPNEIRNNEYPSPSSSISDVIPNNDNQSPLQSSLQYQSSYLFPYNNNFDSSYTINRLLF